MNKNQKSLLTQTILPELSLRPSRVHEVFGSGKYGFAAYHCATFQGPVIWVSHVRQNSFLNPDGLGAFCDPGRFVFTFGKTHLDVLWIAEEALRSGVAPIVVVEVQKQIDLTAGRRLQLAAEAGKSLGLFLTQEGKGSNAVETRWQCASAYGGEQGAMHCDNNFSDKDSTLFDWSCIKNKSGTLNQWAVCWNGTTYHIHMAKQVRQSKSA